MGHAPHLIPPLPHPTPSAPAWLQGIFNLFDRDGNGTIDVDELEVLMKKLDWVSPQTHLLPATRPHTGADEEARVPAEAGEAGADHQRGRPQQGRRAPVRRVLPLHQEDQRGRHPRRRLPGGPRHADRRALGLGGRVRRRRRHQDDDAGLRRDDSLHHLTASAPHRLSTSPPPLTAHRSPLSRSSPRRRGRRSARRTSKISSCWATRPATRGSPRRRWRMRSCSTRRHATSRRGPSARPSREARRRLPASEASSRRPSSWNCRRSSRGRRCLRMSDNATCRGRVEYSVRGRVSAGAVE